MRRPYTETIEGLRRTLEQIEADLHPIVDAEAIDELKRIVVRRIAELELQAASETVLSRVLAPSRVLSESDDLDPETTAA